MTGKFTRNRLQRALLYGDHLLSDLLYPLGRRVLPHRPKLWWVPRLPVRMHPSRVWVSGPWTRPVPVPPESLRTQPGTKLHPERQQAAYEEAPLHDWFALNPEVRGDGGPTGHMWLSLVSTGPRVQAAARRRAKSNAEVKPNTHQVRATPEELTRAMRLEAARLGLSAVGVTNYDEKYHYAEYHGLNVGETVLVGILEQNFESTQLVPSARSEKAAFTAYAGLEDRMTQLAEWIKAQGYEARTEGYVGEGMAIAYGVAAGLGQLGVNGQLLTPHAGSRCRLHLMTTNAPFLHDAPVDYGIEGVCDECQACVRRCPAGAIPASRKESRGVVKAKLNTKRCLPVLVVAEGCSVCMKVCPIQRYGLPDVIEEFERSGKILGRDTDDLEGYDWPLDGKHYGPGEKPRIGREIYDLAAAFDPTRTTPLSEADKETAADEHLGALGY